MTAESNAPQSPDVPPLLPSKNSLGVWGFVVSLAGLVLTLGVLSPVGLVLSLFALRREPRGLAKAGAAIGGLGTILAVAWGARVVIEVFGVDKAYDKRVRPVVTSERLGEALEAIDVEKAKLGRRPTAAEGNSAIAELRDGWGHALQYQVLDNAQYGEGEYYRILTAGPDGVMGTPDDDGVVGR